MKFANFCRQFIKRYIVFAKSLTNLIQKDITFNWTLQAKKAFIKIKRRFIQKSIFCLFDINKKSIIETDTSNIVIGAIYLQKGSDRKLYFIVYFSKKILLTKQNYNIYKKELLAILKALKY